MINRILKHRFALKFVFSPKQIIDKNLYKLYICRETKNLHVQIIITSISQKCYKS